MSDNNIKAKLSVGVAYSGDGSGLTAEQERQLNKIPMIEQSVEEIANELNSKANASDIPTNTSELNNDSGFLTSIPSEYVTEQEMNEAIANSGSGTGGAGLTAEQEEQLNKIPEMEASINNINESLNTKANTSDIPTNTSELYNDSGFLTSIPSEYVTETEMNEAIANISSGGSVDSSGNIFKNKVANFLGDSQTEKNNHKNKIYYDWVKEILGLSKTNNYGIGGTTIAKKNASDNTAMCVRYANMDNNADLICVMGGVNDRWFNNQLGNFGDTDPITFYGGMETLCNGLLTKYPGKTIIFITPTEQNNASCNNANKTGYTATDFANAMKRVCAKYSIPVFDANTCSGIYPINEANGRIYTTDKLHLNNKGHEVIGTKLSKFILNGANVVVINNGESGGGSTTETYGNIVVSKSATTINEGGTDTFTVKLPFETVCVKGVITLVRATP